ncbi:MAG TPA: ABC transporter permease [Thermodesulfovibrionales bacterium]|nr:ABC transporter permease [Thermodesulfovibrionales bacterium]
MVNTLKEAKEIFRYRELLRNLVLRDVKIRYKRSALGFLWVMLDPLLMLLVFYALFVGLFGRSVGNYSAYVMSGLIMWQFFSQGTKVASLAFLQNRNLINKIYLPKAIFPLSVVASSLVHFIFALVPLFIILLLSGAKLGFNLALLPCVVGIVFVFSLGIALSVATLAVFFHDVIYIYDVVLLGWMYLSAIFYPVSILPEKLQLFMSLNPLYHFISLFRAGLYDPVLLTTEHVLSGVAFALLSFFIGWGIYYGNRDRIIFYL